MNENMRQSAKAGITDKIEKYGPDIEALVKFLPWLESKNKRNLSATYLPQEGESHSIQVPVYDSTLLNFVKTAQKTKFIDRNYVYVYRHKKLETAEDELKMIRETQIMEIENIGAVLSKYILLGMTKSVMWNEGISNGVFYAIVLKLKELMEFWTRPMQ